MSLRADRGRPVQRSTPVAMHMTGLLRRTLPAGRQAPRNDRAGFTGRKIMYAVPQLSIPANTMPCSRLF